MRARRDKLFGCGRVVPLCREAKIKLIHRAKALRRSRAITSKAFFVFEALLWEFHNEGSGICFPSYETIAEKAGCARSTVAAAIKMLERAGLLTWHNRIVRTRISGVIKVIRTSNAYQFPNLLPKSDFRPVTLIKSLSSIEAGPLADSLSRLGAMIQARQSPLRL